VIELTPETIESTVMKSPLPVAVFFTSIHCSPCRAVYPLLEAVAPEYADRLTIVKADTELMRDWCVELKVMSIPRMVIFKDGKEVKRIDPRNKGDMRLQFDAVSAAAAPAADQAALEAQATYQQAIDAAKAGLATSQKEIGEWWGSIIGVEAEAYDAALKPLNDATDEAMAADAANATLSEDHRFVAWARKRHAMQSEARFAEVMKQIEVAEAAFDAVAQPHLQERGRRYDESKSAYEAAIQTARLTYHATTGGWPCGDLITETEES
jgi:thioredoxin 1